MRNVGRVLLAMAVVTVSAQLSWGQGFRDAGSKITGNYDGVYQKGRTYRSYSYVAPSAAVVHAPAVVKAPAIVNNAPKVAVVAPAQKPAVVAAPPAPVRTQQAQNQVRTQRTYSYQPNYQNNNAYRSMRSNTYDPAFRRADAKILGR